MKAPKFSYDWNTGAHGSNASVVCVKFNDIETSLFGKKNGMNVYLNIEYSLIFNWPYLCQYFASIYIQVNALKHYLVLLYISVNYTL